MIEINNMVTPVCLFNKSLDLSIEYQDIYEKSRTFFDPLNFNFKDYYLNYMLQFRNEFHKQKTWLKT